MKASEALKISKEYTPIEYRKMLDGHIECTAELGNNHLYWYVPKHIYETLCELLIRDGYAVKLIDVTDTDKRIIISWN